MSRQIRLPGAPAEPAAHGQERQPRLVLAGQHLQVDAGLARRPARAPRALLLASRTAEVAKASSSSQPSSSACRRAADRRLDQRVGTGRRRGRRRRRGARPAAARACARAAGSAARRGGRRRPAGGRCSSRRRGRRAACAAAVVARRRDAAPRSRRCLGSPTSSPRARGRPGLPARVDRVRRPGRPRALIRADLTWLCSRWTCIFGRGCHGTIAGQASDGCCNHGAYFSDKDDEKRTRSSPRSSPATTGSSTTSATDKNGTAATFGETVPDDDEKRRKTRVVDGACIFANRADHPGGIGCALHGLALRIGLHPLETKPEVCWQLPVRREQEWVDRPDEHPHPALDDHRVRPPRLGRGRPRPGLVLHRRRPRRTSAASRCTCPTAPS